MLEQEQGVEIQGKGREGQEGYGKAEVKGREGKSRARTQVASWLLS